MSHPRVEEVSDSDPDIISDPEEVDLDDFAESDILRARVPGNQRQQQQQQQSSSSDDNFQRLQAAMGAAAGANPAAAMQMLNPLSGPQTSTLPASADRSAYNSFQCLYPVYFDASRSRAEGRRVSAALAVKNPLAREIANACSRLRLQTLLEPEKIHPKDWANPGRVKVGLKKMNGSSGVAASGIKNKHHLYVLVAKHLQENPTTEDSPGLRLRFGGQVQPPEGKPYPKPAVPRGWKMGEYLPYLSAAMTGGGVSENLFKDMMKEMQGGADPMAALMASQGGAGGMMGGGGGGGAEEGAKKKKKDKKGKGKV
ncbi:signal recognition particle, SRP19 subunit [Trichoderma reesei RUT C-30]|jgi:signal recognition particle subunit SRP19|uniref:Signal recognition particle, SRP19 subunit n=1 Tax=Hypocrea jecorina (strain ATCC 56765 / BCRC 32924 / NRRL 11460 / Rut C-30) TaxID=1344414 RepID=A0A024SMS7_HYPJR|nr:signal recognition particle, SRP19 subunit [Trichoderma reesei RUT C-30]